MPKKLHKKRATEKESFENIHLSTEGNDYENDFSRRGYDYQYYRKKNKKKGFCQCKNIFCLIIVTIIIIFTVKYIRKKKSQKRSLKPFEIENSLNISSTNITNNELAQYNNNNTSVSTENNSEGKLNMDNFQNILNTSNNNNENTNTNENQNDKTNENTNPNTNTNEVVPRENSNVNNGNENQNQDQNQIQNQDQNQNQNQVDQQNGREVDNLKTIENQDPNQRDTQNRGELVNPDNNENFNQNQNGREFVNQENMTDQKLKEMNDYEINEYKKKLNEYESKIEALEKLRGYQEKENTELKKQYYEYRRKIQGLLDQMSDERKREPDNEIGTQRFNNDISPLPSRRISEDPFGTVPNIERNGRNDGTERQFTNLLNENIPIRSDGFNRENN